MDVLPSGRFGATAGLTTSRCTGQCLEGYGCEPGSTNPRAQLCPPGRYSTAGVCLNCPPGRYGLDAGMASDQCTDVCLGGHWGGGNSSTPECSGLCPAGFRCPPGFTSPTPGDAYKCPAGTYSVEGSAVCSPCRAGYFGRDTNMTDPTCSGECQPGASCPEGSQYPIPYVGICANTSMSGLGSRVKSVPPLAFAMRSYCP
jgi:hypothetical protein